MGATAELRRRGLKRKQDEMELMAWGVCNDGGSIRFEHEGQGHEVRELGSVKTMGALITTYAESVIAVRFMMSQADRAGLTWFAVHALTEATWREIGGSYGASFQETQVTGIPWHVCHGWERVPESSQRDA